VHWLMVSRKSSTAWNLGDGCSSSVGDQIGRESVKVVLGYSWLSMWLGYGYLASLVLVVRLWRRLALTSSRAATPPT
jgi:hypothetical protein